MTETQMSHALQFLLSSAKVLLPWGSIVPECWIKTKKPAFRFSFRKSVSQPKLNYHLISQRCYLNEMKGKTEGILNHTLSL